MRRVQRIGDVQRPDLQGWLRSMLSGPSEAAQRRVGATISRTHLRTIGVACVLTGSLGSCVPPAPTQILFTLTSDLDATEIDTLRVRVLRVRYEDRLIPAGSADCDRDGLVSRNGFHYEQTLCRDFPVGPGGEVERIDRFTLGVVPFPEGPAPDAGEMPIEVGLEVNGLLGGMERMRSLVHVSFESGRRDITLGLSESCLDFPPCDGPGQTCVGRTCVSARWTGGE